MRAILDGFAAFKMGRRSHPGWLADPHLRKGFFVGLGVIALPVLLFLLVVATRPERFLVAFLGYLFCCLVGNVVWFAVAAWSRARG